jgi:microsomal dipeptidase-like Zn-dependent dipeptidase
MPRRTLRFTSAAAIVAAAAATGSASASVSTDPSTDSLANRCVVIRSETSGRFVAVGQDGYSAQATSRARATRFFVKPSGLGTFMLYDRGAKLMSAGAHHRVMRATVAGPQSEWALQQRADGSSLSIRSTAARRLLTEVSPAGSLILRSGGGTPFILVSDAGCTPFPEALVGASGNPFKGPRPGAKVFGFVDAHLHITANMRAGGRVIYGEPFDRFGIPAALGQDAKYHGADGGLDTTGNLLRSGSPTGTHDTHGWPTFVGWPTYNTQTHQQIYYKWLQRVWKAGERLVVAQTVDDEPLCLLEPRRNDGCNETRSILAQIRMLRGLQDYIDAQSGGRGRGWFRLVFSPAQARTVIAAGKLAVIIGIESSDPFGCGVVAMRTQCTRADVEHGLRMYERAGVRGMFVAHWINNAFAGAALESGAKGIFINILDRLQTGSYFTTGPCPGAGQGAQVISLPKSVLEFLAGFFPSARSVATQGMPSYPSGLQCNVEGLTAIGRYLIERMIAHHMLIEVDHLSEYARDTVLAIAERARYPLISSHNGTGGTWTAAELVRLYRLGGFAAVTPAQAPTLASKIIAMSAHRDPRRYLGVGIGTDTGGFASLPAPRPDALQHPLRYPFKSYDGRVTFVREQAGTRTFDLNRDGVAHYGLMADLLADMRSAPGGSRALSLLFRSAEAYLEMWERAVGHR